MSDRRFKVGEAVIWTNYADGKPHEVTILAHLEPDDYDPAEYGPLYEVTGWGQVAEANLSPRPHPPLSAIRAEGEAAMSDDQPGKIGHTQQLVVHAVSDSPGPGLTDDRVRDLQKTLIPLIFAASGALKELGVVMELFPAEEPWRDHDAGRLSFVLSLTPDGDKACWRDDCPHLESAEQEE